jgi:hypothetical protein
MSDYTFERTIQITKIVILVALFILGSVAYLNSPRPANAQLGSVTGFSYVNITTATNTLAKGAAGTLHTVVLGTIGTGTTATLVDTSAANCTGGAPIGIVTLAANMPPQAFDLQFNNGLCITTAGAPNLTVTFR